MWCFHFTKTKIIANSSPGHRAQGQAQPRTQGITQGRIQTDATDANASVKILKINMLIIEY